MQMSMEEINNLRSLLAKATPGPWEVRYSPRTTEECIVVGPRPETMGYAPCILAEDYTGFGEWPVREADHLLVAAMRNAFPDLLDLAERALAERGEERERVLKEAAAIPDGIADGLIDYANKNRGLFGTGPAARKQAALFRKTAAAIRALPAPPASIRTGGDNG